MTVDKIRLAVNVPDRRRPVWLGFDYRANWSESPCYLFRQPDLAASEILSAVIQFPDWLFTESTTTPWPHIAGFEASRNGAYWAEIPYLKLRSDGPTPELWLSQRRLRSAAGRLKGQWVSPTVREL